MIHRHSLQVQSSDTPFVTPYSGGSRVNTPPPIYANYTSIDSAGHIFYSVLRR